MCHWKSIKDYQSSNDSYGKKAAKDAKDDLATFRLKIDSAPVTHLKFKKDICYGITIQDNEDNLILCSYNFYSRAMVYSKGIMRVGAE